MSESTAPLDADSGGDPAPLPDNQAEPGSLRERLEASYDAIEKREAEEEAPEAKPDAEPKPAALRGEGGKFAPKSPPAEQPGAEKIAPPAWLTGKAAVDWNRLPPTVREALAAAVPPAPAEPPPQQTQAPADPIRAVAQQYADHFTSRGIPLEQGIASLLQTYRAMEQNPAEMLRHLAGQYGVPWGDPSPQQPQQRQASNEGQPYRQPTAESETEAAKLYMETEWLKRELADLRNSHLSVQQQQQAQQRESNARRVHEAATVIDNFASDPANPRPHFDAVKEDMALLIRSGRAKDLADAYDRAVWGNPQLRASLLAEQQAKAAEDAAKAARERQAAADRARIINARTVGTSGAIPNGKGSIRDTMERVAAGIE